MRRSCVVAALLIFILAAPGARAEYRLVSDVVSAGAADGQSATYRLRGSVGESPSGTVSAPPWVLQQGFWFLWRGVTGIEEEAAPPRSYDFQLEQNAPNPFNPVTRITFVVPGRTGEPVPTRLDIIDVRGRLVCTLVNDPLPPGTHEVAWSGHNRSGHLVGSGVYFYRLHTGGQTATRRLVVLK